MPRTALNIIMITLFSFSAIAQNLDSKGNIENMGKIVIRGNAAIAQDTLGGQVVYERNLGGQQLVPKLVYNDIEFRGIAPKQLYDISNREFVSLSRFFSDSVAHIKFGQNEIVYTKGYTEHNGLINRNYNYGRVKLNGIDSQDVTGKGLFRELELDNNEGADVVKQGGFYISTRLELLRGEFRLDADSSFTMMDNSEIVRHTGSSLTNEPHFEDKVNVRFVGDGPMLTGGEIPANTTSLQNLIIENDGGITLAKDATYNDSLYLGAWLRTEPDATTKYVLTSTSLKDPVFAEADIEIDGSYRRTNLVNDGREHLFNNVYTYAKFETDADATGITSLQMRVKGETFPVQPGGDEKVMRLIDIEGRDIAGNIIDKGINMEFGYGWKHRPGEPGHETNTLPVPDVILQRYSNDGWINIDNSQVPQTDINKWAHAYATQVTALGSFAIGLPSGLRLQLLARVILEGAFRLEFSSMAIDLNDRGLIPTTPPDIYPYNLDPNRQLTSVTSVPDSIVDWIVIEFRPEFSSPERTYRTCFLRQDGYIVDLDGVSPVLLSPSKGGIDSGGGDYFISIRHRNHMAIITENPVAIYPEEIETTLDFRKPDLVMGRTGAMRPIGFDIDGSVLWGMLSGNNGSNQAGLGIIDEQDWTDVWNSVNIEGYIFEDYNLDGIVTTKDFNKSWNNRYKVGFAD